MAQIFQFEGQAIRFIEGKPVANDVAVVLGYANPAKTISTKVKSKNKGVARMLTPGGLQQVTFLEEAGIYSLIFSSKLPIAEKFQDWLLENIKLLQPIDFYGIDANSVNKSGFVYLAMVSDTQWCKIGMSKKPYKRMSSLQTNNPQTITLIHRIFTFDMAALEKSLHTYYKDYWMKGEWFDLTDALIKDFPLVANQLDSNIEQHSLPENVNKIY